jgi:hypothetical protein
MSDCLNCKKLNKELHRLYLQLVAEQQKNELYKQIIEQKLNLTINNETNKLDDLIEAINSRFFNTTSSSAVLLPEHIPKPQQTIIQTKKKNFKVAPKTVELIEEGLCTDFKVVDTRLQDENIEIFGMYDVEVNKDLFNDNMSQLKISKSTKDCTTLLTNIKTQRQLFQITMSPSDYSTFLVEHIDDIKKSINSNTNIEKKLDTRKMNTMLSKILTSLEQRITFQQGFQSQTLSIDEIQKFERCLKLSAKYPKTFRSFSPSTFCDFFTNYSLALFPASKIFEMYIENPYGFKNLIYINMDNDAEFAFYTLEKYDGTTRFWNLDSRLEELTYKLRDVIRDYCVMLFRKIYKLCFNTNDYSETYKSKYNVLEFDCEQLIQNIIFTIDFKTLNTTFTNLVKKHCTYTPTLNDKFSSCSDSEEQVRSFKRYRFDESEISGVVGSIFDNIKDLQCFEIYKSVSRT